jgi:Ca-activated chloride channel family protein
MFPEAIHSYAIWAALAAAGIATCGEWMHARRVARLGALAFGPSAKPRAWTSLTPLLRVIGLAGAAWALVTLIAFNGQVRERDRKVGMPRNLMVMLDVSPSMLLTDAGEGGAETRNSRATAVLKSVLDRVPGDNVRFSAAGFYTEARMMVKECQDRELILHLAGGTPFHITYSPGKTDILASLNQTGEFMKDWPRKSTTLLVISDGDSMAPTGLKPMPTAVSDVIIAGVGDSARGTFIDGHLSRQDTANLSQLARRIGGKYFDCNVRHVPTDALRKLNTEEPGAAKWRTDRRLAALLVLAFSSVLLCLAPLMLEWFGSAWRPRAAALSKLSPLTDP